MHTGQPWRLLTVSITLTALLAPGCAWLHPQPPFELALTERPRIALLPIGLNVDITSLSTVKTLEQSPSPEDEPRLIAEAIHDVAQEARWLLLSRLAARQGFQFVPLEETDAAVAALGLKPGALPTAEQVSSLGQKLNADLVMVATIEDYGKVRWQWLLVGMLTDMTAESIILGVATSWNPIAIFANIGFELLTSTPVWFGGGYLFGVALRPVRVEARTYETGLGYPIWQEMEIALYAWRLLKELPESERGKKEAQLRINLATAMEALAESLSDQHFAMTQLRGSEEPSRR